MNYKWWCHKLLWNCKHAYPMYMLFSGTCALNYVKEKKLQRLPKISMNHVMHQLSGDWLKFITEHAQSVSIWSVNLWEAKQVYLTYMVFSRTCKLNFVKEKKPQVLPKISMNHVIHQLSGDWLKFHNWLCTECFNLKCKLMRG